MRRFLKFMRISWCELKANDSWQRFWRLEVFERPVEKRIARRGRRGERE